MSQTTDSMLSKRTRRRGKWKQNWIRKNSGNLAKKQKLMDNTAEDVIVKFTPPTVVGLQSKPHVDKVGTLSLHPKRKFSDPLHLWRKTYENLLKWQTTHQLNYWKNNSRNLHRENTKLKEDIYVLKAQINGEQNSIDTDHSDEVIDLEKEETPLESSAEENMVTPNEDDKHVKFLKFLKATAAYNKKKM